MFNYAESYVRMFHDCETQLHCDNYFLLGQGFNQDTVCTAFREAGIQLPDWAKIAKQLPVSMHLQISAEEFFEGWFAYTDGYQRSWVKLAQALERTGIPNYKQAACKVWQNQGT